MGKIIAVLDTNIYVSSVFWLGKSALIIEKAINQEFIAFISNDIVKELRRALKSSSREIYNKLYTAGKTKGFLFFRIG